MFCACKAGPQTTKERRSITRLTLLVIAISRSEAYGTAPVQESADVLVFNVREGSPAFCTERFRLLEEGHVPHDLFTYLTVLDAEEQFIRVNIALQDLAAVLVTTQPALVRVFCAEHDLPPTVEDQ